MKRRAAIALLLAVLLLAVGGCKMNFGRLYQPQQNDKAEMVKVIIYFTDGKELTGYVENLGMEGSSKIYTGGSSVNNVYDRSGKIIGCFNYQHVLYMKILPENENN
ncbi:MAG TPA: hypothetical protein VHQ70_05025 [Syntrophomonadaceae bacterium]|nr:hypothetical protein [Syntrophomonadaceae bacterium]